MNTNIITAAMFAVLSIRASAVVNIDWVTVGNLNNPSDPLTGQGKVNYEYRIGKYEVTIGQYAEFLNQAAKSDPYGLWNSNMQTDLNIAGISRVGTPGSYTYFTMGSANRPITYVSWFDAARFCNWLQNGQGSGSTETGVYALNGATSGNGFTAQAGARFRLPSADEWLKAASYDPNPGAGGGDNYWKFSTRSDTNPGNNIGSMPNQANYLFDNGSSMIYSVTQVGVFQSTQNYLTNVGAFSGSSSYYGTFDQSGNVAEWTDEIPYWSSDRRSIEGGSWQGANGNLISNGGSAGFPTLEDETFGFRLARGANTAPAFAGYSVATAWQTAASISLAKLLTKAADADGDTLSITNAGPASTQGGTAVLQSGSILYTPPAAFSGTDTFSVTIADGYGASVSGTVTVSVAPNPNSGGQGVNPPQITMPGNGTAMIASQGIPGRTYMVQRSTNLSNWISIGTVTAASNGAVSFIDPNPPQPSAFYRLGRNAPELNFWGNGSDGTLTTSGNISFGSVQDGDVVVKQFTNLTINAGHTVTTSNRCRGLVIYVNGDCTINGTLSMTARGANVDPTQPNSIAATGIRLARFKYGANETLAASDLGGTGLGGVGSAWRTAEANQLGISGTGRIYTIAREGGAGGGPNHTADWWSSVYGGTGGTNPNGTGGGGGGNAAGGWSGAGSAGTCYSGGSGGGAVRTNGYATSAGNAAPYGGPGGYGAWTSPHDQAGGGAGNGGGGGNQPGQSGTGGLLVLMVKGNLSIGATGQVVSQGSNGGSAYQSGGGSGGGRILILHAGNYSAAVTPSAAGGSGGGGGGAGAVTIEKIDP